MLVESDFFFFDVGVFLIYERESRELCRVREVNLMKCV